MNRDFQNRPKGCHKTITGMHIPTIKQENYGLTFFCSACGLIDDTNKFSEWFGFCKDKIDDKLLTNP